METEENKLHEQEGINLDQTLPGPNPEDAAAVLISDDDETDLPIDMPQAVPTPFHCHGGLGPFVHSRRFAEISSGGTIFLY